MNLKTLSALQVYYLIRLLTLFGILYPVKKYSKNKLKIKDYKRWYKELFQKVIFSEILVIYFGSLLELLIAGSLFYDTPKDNKVNNVFNTIIAFYFIFVPMLGLPIAFCWMFTKSITEIREKKF